MTDRYRLSIEPDLPLPEVQPKPRPKPPIWRQLKLNKNLCNFPLARSARTKVKWNMDAQGWWCKLPGEKRIELAVAADTPKEKMRLPTGFDMNVLYRLFVAVQEAWPQRVERLTFDSKAAFLRDLHLPKKNKNSRRLLDSLDLWSNLSIHFVPWRKHPAPWYVPGQSQTIAKDLAPPIRKFVFQGRKIVVTLDERERCHGEITFWTRELDPFDWQKWGPQWPAEVHKRGPRRPGKVQKRDP